MNANESRYENDGYYRKLAASVPSWRSGCDGVSPRASAGGDGPVGAGGGPDGQGLMSAQSDAPYPLAMAAVGEPVRILAVGGGRGLARRMADLGLAVGAEVRVVQRLGGQVVVARDGARIALGGGMAMKILVAAAAGCGHGRD